MRCLADGAPARPGGQRFRSDHRDLARMTELAFLSATDLAKRIRTREIGSRELLEYFVARIGKYNPTVNAVVVMDLERERKEADAADRAVASSTSLPPLHGVPMTVKESFMVAGLPTTFGLPL